MLATLCACSRPATLQNKRVYRDGLRGYSPQAFPSPYSTSQMSGGIDGVATPRAPCEWDTPLVRPLTFHVSGWVIDTNPNLSAPLCGLPTSHPHGRPPYHLGEVAAFPPARVRSIIVCGPFSGPCSRSAGSRHASTIYQVQVFSINRRTMVEQDVAGCEDPGPILRVSGKIGRPHKRRQAKALTQRVVRSEHFKLRRRPC
jgi:hypothetical protein